MQRIRNHPRLILAGALLLILISLLALSVVSALAQPAEPEAFGMTWDVFANGGATMSSAHYRMLSTAGQPLTSISTSSRLRLHSGYWYGLQDVLRRIFLPNLNRNY